MPLKYTETQLALKNYFEALSTLKRLGIVPNKKDFTSQIGEWLVNEIYNGALALNPIQKHWDLKLDHIRIQVKTHAKASTNKNRWTPIEYNSDAEIDILIIVIFSEDYGLKEFYSVPWKEALTLIRVHKYRKLIYWDHLKNFKIELDELPNQEVISLLKLKAI
jgi:hypothetical protein